MKRIIAACLLLSPITIPAAAGPLRPGWVSADAAWVAHIDVDALRDSSLGQFILEHRDEIDVEFGELEELGLDPAEDFYSITLYGSERPREDGTIIVQMNEKIDGIIAYAKEEGADIEEIEILGRTAYSFDDGETFAYINRNRRTGRRTIVITQDVDRLIHAIEVIRGDRESLDDGGALDVDPREGAMLYARAIGTDWMDDRDGVASQVARMSDGFTVEAGENNGKAYAEVELSSDDEENVGNIAALLNGVVALGRMAATQDDSDLAELSHLLNAISISNDDDSIKIRCAMNVEALLAIAGEAMENRGHHDDFFGNDDDEDDDHDDDDNDDDDDDWDND